MNNSLTNALGKIYKDSLIKNSLQLIVTNFSSLILGFFFWMVATRLYNPGDIGIISAILSSMTLIASLSTIGLPAALTFYLPIYRQDAGKIINSCLIISIIISIIFSMIFLLSLMLAPELKVALGDLKLSLIFIITSIVTTMSLLMSGMFVAGRRSSFQMAKENVFSIVKIFLLVLFSSLGAIGIFISWSFGLIIATIIGLYLLFKLWKYIPTISFDPIVKNMAHFSIGTYIAGIMGSFPRLVFPIIIVRMISADATGYFFIAMMIASVLSGVPESLVGPFLAESSDKSKFWDNVVNAIRLNITLLIPGLLGIIIFGKYILNIFNSNYADNSFNTTVILSIASVPMSFVTIFNMINNAQKKIMVTIKLNTIASIMVIITSIPLMKIWNIEGIAVAYLVTYTIISIYIIVRTENYTEFALKIIRKDRTIDKNIV
jgi:O-antigen/teichoic acid export membrane protein